MIDNIWERRSRATFPEDPQLEPLLSASARFSLVYGSTGKRHHPVMAFIKIVFELFIEIGRAIIVETMAGRFRRVRIRANPKGMAGVRRHVHARTRRRLFNRLSTDRLD